MGVERIRCIECEADRRRALERIEALRDADPDSEEGHERDVLIAMVSKWEAKGKPRYGQVGTKSPARSRRRPR